MVKQKKKFFQECPKCYRTITGFSEHHAKMNLMIHLKTSERCKEIQNILKKRGLDNEGRDKAKDR